jgi:hypothetical protein
MPDTTPSPALLAPVATEQVADRLRRGIPTWPLQLCRPTDRDRVLHDATDRRHGRPGDLCPDALTTPRAWWASLHGSPPGQHASESGTGAAQRWHATPLQVSAGGNMSSSHRSAGSMFCNRAFHQPERLKSSRRKVTGIGSIIQLAQEIKSRPKRRRALRPAPGAHRRVVRGAARVGPRPAAVLSCRFPGSPLRKNAAPSP